MAYQHRLHLEFAGAAETVTGSRTLVHYDNSSYLVDCGLFQGPKQMRLRNWDLNEKLLDIDAVFLTHAHVDHSGYLPKLAKEGFDGPIYCSHGTFDLCQLMLRDSAYLQEEDAKFFAKHKLSKFDPPLPLYNLQDAERALKLFRPVAMDQWIEIEKGMSVRFLRAGHILGASFVQLSCECKNGVKILTFSGDVGNEALYVIKGPTHIRETDFLVIEGTYGDKSHPDSDPMEELATIINRTYEDKGVLIIPSFAVGRTQELLYMITQLEIDKKIPDVNIYVDSPMANNATDIFLRHENELKIYEQEQKLVKPICPKNFKAIRKVEDSKALGYQQGPFIVISSAGMLTGGRVLHHLKARLPDPKNCVLFVGYQAEETKGRLLQSGIPKIRIHKELVDVNAKIVTMDSLSAHADSQGLVDWVGHFEPQPQKVFLNHGRPESLRALKYRLKTELGIKAEIPKHNQSFDLLNGAL